MATLFNLQAINFCSWGLFQKPPPVLKPPRRDDPGNRGGDVRRVGRVPPEERLVDPR